MPKLCYVISRICGSTDWELKVVFFDSWSLAGLFSEFWFEKKEPLFFFFNFSKLDFSSCFPLVLTRPFTVISKLSKGVVWLVFESCCRLRLEHLVSYFCTMLRRCSARTSVDMDRTLIFDCYNELNLITQSFFVKL